MWNAHIFLFGLTLRDIPNSITPLTTLRLLPIPVGLLVLTCIHQCKRSPPPPPPPPPPYLCFLSRTQEPAKSGTCARDRRALQQLVLNVHVKHSDLTWPNGQECNFGQHTKELTPVVGEGGGGGGGERDKFNISLPGSLDSVIIISALFMYFDVIIHSFSLSLSLSLSMI